MQPISLGLFGSLRLVAEMADEPCDRALQFGIAQHFASEPLKPMSLIGGKFRQPIRYLPIETARTGIQKILRICGSQNVTQRAANSKKCRHPVTRLTTR